MSLNPTPDIGDDLRRTLESSGDPHNIVGFLAWVYANAKTDDPHDVTSFEFQLRCFKNGVAYLSPREGGTVVPFPEPHYHPARWVDDHWEAIPDAPPIPPANGGGELPPSSEFVTVDGPKSANAFERAVTALGWELKFNTMSKTAFLNGAEIDDLTIARVRYTFETRVVLAIHTSNGTIYRPFKTSQKQVAEWLLELALTQGSFHPVQNYLADRPKWDKTARVDGLLDLVLGGTIQGDTRHGDLARIASSNIIMSLVTRAMEPGCPWPLMTILWGPQGICKSTFLDLLMPPDSEMHYESATFPLSDEELFDYTRNAWLIEFSDPSTKRTESEGAKTFISRKSYTYRHKYGRMSTHHPYNFAMVASANPDGNSVIPPDASGYRRYLSVDCERRFSYPELKVLMDDIRDQLWAEALYRYNAGERFQEIPEALQPIRDAAAGAKAGSEYLEGFTEYIADRLEKDDTDRAAGVSLRDPSKGYSMDELIEGFLKKNDVMNISEVSVDRVVSFRRQNAAQLTACLKQLGMVNKPVGKKRAMRWFR